jgi:hypothetical protein
MVSPLGESFVESTQEPEGFAHLETFLSGTRIRFFFELLSIPNSVNDSLALKPRPQ